jgi:uncharacterized Zn finger protein
MRCPRCDGQGIVRHAIVKATSQPIFICDECDAVWFSVDDVATSRAIDFRTYVSQFGLEGLWSELAILDDRSIRSG